MLRCLLLLFCSGALQAWQHQVAVVEPIDVLFQQQRVKILQIGQLAAEDAFLYLRTTQAPTILVLGHSGLVEGGIGGPGQPGFQQGGPLSMAVRGDELWSLDNAGERVHHFVKGQPIGSFLLRKGDMPMAHMAPSNAFASDGKHLIFSAPNGSGALGVVYDLSGKRIQTLGEALDLGPGLAEMTPAMNEALWFFHQDTFYAVHKFFPMISMFDQVLQPKGQIQYTGEQVTTRLNAIHQFQPTKWMTVPTPLVTDAAVHEGMLYVMCSGALHRIDPGTGAVAGITTFVAGDGLEVAPGSVLNLHYLAFLGRFVYLAHPAMLWDHDLWRVPISGL